MIRLLGLVCAIYSSSVNSLVHEKAHTIHGEYLKEADADAQHTVVIAVQQNKQGLAYLKQLVRDISDLNSPNYAKYLSRDTVADLTANKQKTHHILEYFSKAGAEVVKTSLHGEYITLRGSISLWSTHFKTTFNEYLLPTTGKVVIRCEEYYVPEELRDHISGVLNIIHFPVSLSSPAIPQADPSFSDPAIGYVTPTLLNSFYNVANNTVTNTSSTRTVYANAVQWLSMSDLSEFQTKFNIPPSPIVVNVSKYNKDDACFDTIDHCLEANLDVQYTSAIAQGSTIVFSNDEIGDEFTSWILSISSENPPPLVISISYGFSDNDIGSRPPRELFDTEALKLIAQGTTLVVSTGDDGASGIQARGKPENCGYDLFFPATSQYVLSVGATSGPENGKPEVVCQSDRGGVITSGGGFSTYEPVPSYQADAISNYFTRAAKEHHLPEAGYGSGRGTPDVALLGHFYSVVLNGTAWLLSGTSAGTPVLAAFITLTNSYRLNHGIGPLGWINPSLYANYEKYTNDVPSGNNKCPAQDTEGFVTCCSQGFFATTGWDPVTGFGSVDFSKFLQVYLYDIIGGGPGVSSRVPTSLPTGFPSVKPTIVPPTPKNQCKPLKYTTNSSSHLTTETVETYTFSSHY